MFLVPVRFIFLLGLSADSSTCRINTYSVRMKIYVNIACNARDWSLVHQIEKLKTQEKLDLCDKGVWHCTGPGLQ